MKNIHTLQELNLDAARYRWVRENVDLFIVKDQLGMPTFSAPEVMDDYISKVLEVEND